MYTYTVYIYMHIYTIYLQYINIYTIRIYIYIYTIWNNYIYMHDIYSTIYLYICIFTCTYTRYRKNIIHMFEWCTHHSLSFPAPGAANHWLCPLEDQLSVLVAAGVLERHFGTVTLLFFNARSYYLIGGLEHEFYDFPFIGNNTPNWLSYFFRGVETTNQL